MGRFLRAGNPTFASAIHPLLAYPGALAVLAAIPAIGRYRASAGRRLQLALLVAALYLLLRTTA